MYLYTKKPERDIKERTVRLIGLFTRWQPPELLPFQTALRLWRGRAASEPHITKRAAKRANKKKVQGWLLLTARCLLLVPVVLLFQLPSAMFVLGSVTE